MPRQKVHLRRSKYGRLFRAGSRKKVEKFSKWTIASDIEKFLIREGMIHKNWKVVIPEGGYDYQRERIYILWDGNFEVFRTPNDIASYGSFRAQVPIGITSKEDYALVIHFKGKEYWIYD